MPRNNGRDKRLRLLDSGAPCLVHGDHRYAMILKLPIRVVPTTCDDFVKRRLGNSLYINIGAVIPVDTDNLGTDDTVLGNWQR